MDISQRMGGGYIVSEATLRKVARLIETFSGNAPEIRLTFRGERTINSTKPDEVFGDSFIQSTPISQITISNDYRSSQRASVEFRRDESSPIHFTASGDRQQVIAFESDLLNELTPAKAWYSRLVISQYTAPSHSYAFYEIVIVISIVILLLFIASHYWDVEYRSNRIITVTTIIFAINFIIACCYFAFPSMVFGIGKGARRQVSRTAIWSFIILVLVVGIAINFISDWLKTLF
jgi:hypothetical protein